MGKSTCQRKSSSKVWLRKRTRHSAPASMGREIPSRQCEAGDNVPLSQERQDEWSDNTVRKAKESFLSLPHRTDASFILPLSPPSSTLPDEFCSKELLKLFPQPHDTEQMSYSCSCGTHYEWDKQKHMEYKKSPRETSPSSGEKNPDPSFFNRYIII